MSKLNLAPGSPVAVHHRYATARGTVLVVGKTVLVRMDNGALRRFAPVSGFEIPVTGARLISVAEADRFDREIAEVRSRPAARVADSAMLSWIPSR